MGKHKRNRSRSSDRHSSQNELLQRLIRLEKKLERSGKDRSRSRSGTSASPSRLASRHRDCGSRGRAESRRDRRKRESRSPSAPVSHSPVAGTSRVSGSEADSRQPTGHDDVSVHDFESDGEHNTPGPEQAGALVPGDADNSPGLLLHNDVALPDEILEILGDDPNTSKSSGYKLHDALASRWKHILCNGLSKEEAAKLEEKLSIPENCKNLLPPEVNPELKSIMPSLYSVRDLSHFTYQVQLGKGIARLGQAINLTLEGGENLPKPIKATLLSHLSDASRTLCNVFHDISQTRRHLIGPILSKQVKDLVDKTPPGDLLFGPELGEQIRAAKLLEKAGKELRPPTQANYTFSPTKRGGGATTKVQAGPSTKRPMTLNRNRPAHMKRDMRPYKGQTSREQPYRKRR